MCTPLLIAAAAVAVVGGVRSYTEKKRAADMGIKDINRKFSMHEMAAADVIFSATGVTDGSLLSGVHFRQGFAETETVVMRAATGTVRRIKTTFRMIGTKATV